MTPNGLGTFAKDDGLLVLTVSHQTGKRNRRAIRLKSTKVAADPFVSGVNLKYDVAIDLVVNEPLVGYTRAELKLIVDGFLAYLTASSGAKVTQLLAGEN